MPDHFNFTRTFFPVKDARNGFGLIGTVAIYILCVR